MAPPGSALARTSWGALRCANALGRTVYRLGYAPDPWAFTPWQYAQHGRFPGRWDDPDGTWRTVYAGDSLLACYLEVLAVFRPDPTLIDQLAAITENANDPANPPEGHNADDPASSTTTTWPASPAGTLPRSWLQPRLVGTARLHGWHAQPAARESLPTLRTGFLTLARQLGLPDLDAAAVRLADPRTVTQHIAGWLYQQDGPDATPLRGVQFQSRHGDDLTLWAVFERPGGQHTPKALTDRHAEAAHAEDPALQQAMHLHHLRWDDAATA